jgi:hypothetical protein
MYEGNWKEDKKHGFGKQTIPDGRVYEGYWEDGKEHGKGKETFAMEPCTRLIIRITIGMEGGK